MFLIFFKLVFCWYKIVFSSCFGFDIEVVVFLGDYSCRVFFEIVLVGVGIVVENGWLRVILWLILVLGVENLGGCGNWDIILSNLFSFVFWLVNEYFSFFKIVFIN